MVTEVLGEATYATNDDDDLSASMKFYSRSVRNIYDFTIRILSSLFHLVFR